MTCRKQMNIDAVTLTAAATEQTWPIPDNTLDIEIKCRTSAVIKMAVVKGETADNYRTIAAGEVWKSPAEMSFEKGSKLFFLPASDGLVAEIVYTTKVNP